MSDSMEQAVVQDLRIELTPLPPLCPDGKAIVERMIREIKRRMANSRMKGVYAQRPLDPRTKGAAKDARAIAVHSLADAYRLLIQIIDDHNNRPHSTLRRRRVLTQAGVMPTPKFAYLWGLKHITGLRTAPFSDADYRRMLLSVDTASIANGVLRYRSRPYLPANEAASEIAAASTTRAKAIAIRLDKTDPHEVCVADARGQWAVFRMTLGAASEIAGLTLDEEEAFAEHTARLWARADHASRLERVTAKNTKSSAKTPAKTSRNSSSRVLPIQLNKQQQLQAREKETADMKRKLTGQPIRAKSKPDGNADAAPASSTQGLHEVQDWATLEARERLQNLELIRRHRSKH